MRNRPTSGGGPRPGHIPFRFGTWNRARPNIRTSRGSDGRDRWWFRRATCVAAIRAVQADVIALQEVRPDALRYLRRAFPGYAVAGRGRDRDGRGEYAAVLVGGDWTLESHDTRWLSPTPNVPGSLGWDAGLTYAGFAGEGLTLGGVIVNIGQPVVRGLRQRLTFVPAFTWHPRPLAALGLSAHSRVTPDSVVAYAFGLSWISTNQAGIRWPIAIMARLDTDGGLRRGAFSLGLSIGSQDRFGVVTSTPGDVSRIDEASLYGLSTREPSPRRR